MDGDIRKLPPPALASRHSRSGSQSGSRTASTPSEQGGTDSATAVETGRDTTTLISFEEAPLRSFRKKRRGAYDRTPLVESSPLQKYWSEYDHPEDDDGGDAYVIYIDPDEKSSVERFIEKLGAFFSLRKPDDASAMLDDDQSSGDEDDDDRYPLAAEENRELIPRSHRRDCAAYGTLPYTTEDGPAIMSVSSPALPPTTTLCYVASLAILIVAYFLAYTGKHKYHYAVDAGILLAVLSSVMFAVVGYAVLWRRSELARQWGGTTSWTAWTLATMVLIVDTIASGGLLAWIWTFGRQ